MLQVIPVLLYDRSETDTYPRKKDNRQNDLHTARQLAAAHTDQGEQNQRRHHHYGFP